MNPRRLQCRDRAPLPEAQSCDRIDVRRVVDQSEIVFGSERRHTQVDLAIPAPGTLHRRLDASRPLRVPGPGVMKQTCLVGVDERDGHDQSVSKTRALRGGPPRQSSAPSNPTSTPLIVVTYRMAKRAPSTYAPYAVPMVDREQLPGLL